ncbi:hypothetical protein VTH06DRAFT_8768 [Thermothelomyces fergusii]
MAPVLSSWGVAWPAVGVLSAAIVYIVLRVNSVRRFYRRHDLPQPPHHPIWGHLKLIGEYVKKVSGDYIQAPLTEMKQDLNLPDIFYLDMWPAGPEFIVCSSPDAAAIPTTVSAFAQSSLVTGVFAPTVGTTFIEATNGPLWKELHHMLAPGLTPGAVKTYHQLIVDEAEALHRRFRRLAGSGDVVNVSLELGRYPFSVIWQVIFGEKPDAGSGFYEAAKRLNDIGGPTRRVVNPIQIWQERREKAAIVRKFDREIENKTRARFEELKRQKVLPTRTTASCLLDRMLLDQVQAGLPLDDRLMRLVRENVKGFIIAGYGTTTDTTSYMLMLLSAFPDTLRKLREEHDRVFSKDLDETFRLLRDEPNRVNELHYTTAVINETLRLYPPGMVIRQPPAEMTSFEYKGKTYPVRKGHIFAVMGYSIHYNPEVFEEPKAFRPERFLAPTTTTTTTVSTTSSSSDGSDSVPRSAFRPFERGLRSCMGQNLAMGELRVALVALARGMDFALREHAPAAAPRLRHTDLDTVLGKHAFQTLRFSAGPSGDVLMEVRPAAGRE